MNNYLKRHLIIIDSPSECGKTSLCLHLATKYRFNYYHIKRWNLPIVGYEKDILDFAFDNIQKYDSNFVIERLHLSEEVYANLLGYTSPYKDWKEFDQTLREKANKLEIKYSLVTCLPPKDQVQINDVNEDQLYDGFNEIYDQNRDLIYNYDFTADSDYAEFDNYLENL